MHMLYACIYGSQYDKYMSPETIVRKFNNANYAISQRTFYRFLTRIEHYYEDIKSGKITAKKCPLFYFAILEKKDIKAIVDKVYHMNDPQPRMKRYKKLRKNITILR